MIRYTLGCDEDHRFDAWFGSAEAFDEQLSKGLVACAVCGSTAVRKLPMAPAVRAGSEAQPLSAPASPAEQAMRAMREKVEREADYVGREFASEARQMHEGEIPQRSIWGEAKPSEARALIEDGIAVAPLPRFGPRRAN